MYEALQFIRQRYYELEDLEKLKEDMMHAKGLTQAFMGCGFRFYALRVAGETGIYFGLDWYVI